MRFLPAFLLLLPVSAPAADVVEFIDGRYEQTASMAQTMWELAEVGYQEYRSSELLQEALRAEGFSIETGVADIPTAFIASYGSGKPVIGILAEYDALPGLSQAAVPYRSPIEGKNAAQACGHHLFGSASTMAAIAVRHWLEDSGGRGTIRLYGTPAEEGGSGKVYLVREGLFDDVDALLNWHADDENSARARTTLANRSAKFRFRGVSAHAAGAPHRARSALDGVEAFNHMVNMLREHVPQETRIHYVITSGGSAPNVVPDFAEVFYYVRHPHAATLKKIWPRVEDAARGAAMGTGTEVDWEIIHGNQPVLINETLAKMMDTKLHELGGIEYNAEEQAFAEKLYATLSEPQLRLGSQQEIQPYDVSLGYGSTDVGDVSMTVPTVGVRVATWVPGTSSHSWQAAAAGGTSIGFKGADLAAKVLALGAVEMYSQPRLLRQAKREFDERRGDDFVYEPLLGDRDPPLDYRK
ncbi:MAG: amidohydrolase [Gammaproteobacteria bacterium]|nr:amidohydrolase [Gammaproteobacteria bacterium]